MEGSCKRVWLGVRVPFQPLANPSKLPHLEENRAWNMEGTESGGLPLPLTGRMGATGSILTRVETEPSVLGIEVFPALSSMISTNCQELSLGSLVHTCDKYLLSFYFRPNNVIGIRIQCREKSESAPARQLEVQWESQLGSLVMPARWLASCGACAEGEAPGAQGRNVACGHRSGEGGMAGLRPGG